MPKVITAFLLLIFVSFFVFAQKDENNAKQIKSISEFTKDLRKIDGYLPLFYDDEKGKMYFEVSRLNQEFLYQVSLPTGVGSNPIGLDRGQLGDTKVVYFERVGNKVLLVQPNYGFRALSNNAAEKRAVEESFAKSVVWGFKVAAKDSDKFLIDATDFLIRDAHGVGVRLQQTKQGSYSIDESRSAFYLPNTKGFPKNTEVEATITLTAKGETGRLVNQTSPSGDSVTTRQRHSFVELPDKNYKPREFDPRIGAFAIQFYDYATDISENLEKRWIVRHRLNKKNPNEAISEAVEPIVYYVDNGTPKKIQDALIEGGKWWNAAFEAAGYKNAFQVKVLPADADPLDVRYNVVNWVHRSTRGWAYGSSIVDPRTGEIIKGVVTLDSQRARQDFLIASAFAPQYASNAMCNFAAMPDIDYLLKADAKTDAETLAFARIRQLSAHEIGHTLGFAHNFAASTYGRASVMDYPAPLIKIVDGKLDFSNAYDDKIGVYDKWVTQFAYTDFPAGANEKAELEKILQGGIRKGYLFISDGDTRPASAAHPLANLWDNGSDPVAELKHIMRVRKIGLETFGLNNVDKGMPLSELENKLLPLYLHHRYQTTAATKSIGGVYYSYSVRTGNMPNPSTVYEIASPAKQREALNTVLETIKPEELAIPESILQILPPMAFGYGSARSELFPKRTNPIFDPIGAAEIATDMTIGGLLEPNRAARLITFNARDKNNPHFQGIVDALLKATWKMPVSNNNYHAEIQRTIQSLTVTHLMNLAANEDAQMQVRAVANESLRQLAADMKKAVVKGNTATHYKMTIDNIERFLDRPAMPRKQTEILPEPPGDPIGSN
ncbi:MAG: zinc-dependent metalloprotease [Aridibacter sp.]